MEIQNVGKTYVITGATSGIGQAAAEILARSGASVIGVGRSLGRCRLEQARLARLNPQGKVAFLTADLSLQADVNRLAHDIEDQLEAWNLTALDGLLNNAGTFTYWMKLTPDGFETQWAVNHLAPFLLTRQVLPLLQAAPWARIVTVSSGSHYGAHLNWKDIQLRRRYNGLRAYGSTKLANVLFTQEINRLLGEKSTVRAFAADPGLVQTDIGLKGNPGLVNWIWKLRRSGGISAQESARGIVYLLTEQGIQGADDPYWKHGKPKKPSRRAEDEQAATRLWQISCQMCGLPWQLNITSEAAYAN